MKPHAATWAVPTWWELELPCWWKKEISSTFSPAKTGAKQLVPVEEMTLLLRVTGPMDDRGSGCACVAIAWCLCRCLGLLLLLLSLLLSLGNPLTSLSRRPGYEANKSIYSYGRSRPWDAPHGQSEEANREVWKLSPRSGRLGREVGSSSGLWRRGSPVQSTLPLANIILILCPGGGVAGLKPQAPQNCGGFSSGNSTV